MGHSIDPCGLKLYIYLYTYLLEKIGEDSQPICNYIIYAQSQINFMKHKNKYTIIPNQ